MSWLDRAARRTKALVFLFVAVAIAGSIAATKVPVALFPQVSFPRIVVSIDAGDRPADQMLASVTIPVEEALRAVPGVRQVRSTTSRGSAEASLDFHWGDEMTTALLLVQTAMSQVAPTLPQGTRFNVRRMDPTVFPIVAVSLTSKHGDPINLRNHAYYDIRPRLLGIEGVAKVMVVGGARKELQVVIDPDVLGAYGFTVDSIAKSISSWCTIQALGRIEDLYKLDLILTAPQVTGADTLGQLVMRADGDAVVRLSDLAEIRTVEQPVWTRVTADGEDAVLVQVYQQPAGNTVAISSEVEAIIADFRMSLPEGDQLSVWYDQSDLVKASAASVWEAVILGTLLAGLVLLLFLRNLKVTLISMIVVPGVLASVCLVLLVMGDSLNIMTLGGMAAAVGLIIDDAIVVVEHLIARAGAGRTGDGQAAPLTALGAASEFTLPLFGASMATIIIHLPPAFLTGVTGEFFKALSLTMAMSLIVSFAVAGLLIPLLAGRVLRFAGTEEAAPGRVFRFIESAFKYSLEWALRGPWAVVLACALWVLAGWMAFVRLPSGFMPVMDEGGFVLDYYAEPGTSLTETDRMIRKVEGILREIPETATYSRRTGLQLGGGLTEANQGDMFVRLRPFPRRPIEEVMAEVRQRVETEVPGLSIELLQLMEDLIGDLTAVPQPIEVKLTATDSRVLPEEALHVVAELGEISGIVDLNNGLSIAGDALEVRLDPEAALLHGIDPVAATGQIGALLTGQVVGSVIEQSRVVNVRLWSDEDDRAIESDVGRLRLPNKYGSTTMLSEVASITRLAGQPMIQREGLRETVSVTARTEGIDLGAAARLVQEHLDRPGVLGPGVSYKLGGLFGEQQRAFSSLLWVFVASIGLLFLLILFLFESMGMAIVLTLACLLTMPAVAIGLLVAHTELNISSMMGFAMIVGAAAEIGIFYAFEIIASQKAGESTRMSLVDAACARLRPITMTSLAAVLALAPLALGIGEGAAMLQPLAIGIIAGLIVQVPVVLIVFPALLSLLPHRRIVQSQIQS